MMNFLKHVLNLLKLWLRALRGFVQDDGFFLTAAVSYYAILSLIPIAIIGVTVLGYIYGQSPEATTSFLDYVRRFFPELPSGLKSSIEYSFYHRSALGYFGAVVLLWASTLIFSAMGNAFDKIFKTGESKGLRRHILALTLVFIISFVIVLFVIGRAFFRAYIKGILTSKGLYIEGKGIFSDHVLPPIIYIAFSAFLYYTLPSRKVEKGAILTGALCSGFIWEVGRFIFNWYMTHITRVNIIYGTFGVLIIAVLWIYFSFGVLFWGGELAYLWETDKIKLKNPEGGKK